MAMADDDIFKHMGWLHGVGLLETVNILGVGLGMNRLDVNGVLVFDYNEKIGRGEK